MHLGARQRQHHERPVRERAERGVDEVHARQIAPVQILEHEQDRAAPRTRRRGSSSQARRIWSPMSIASCRARAQLGALGRRASGAPEELAQELRHARRSRAAATLRPTRARSFARRPRAARRRGCPQRAGARSRACRTGEPALSGSPRPIRARAARRPRRATRRRSSWTQARLADAGRRRHQHRRARPARTALVRERREEAELALAPDARRRLAEQRARRRRRSRARRESSRPAASPTTSKRGDRAGRP